MNKNPFGKNGDFITAPNISILFSEMLAIWCIAFWQNLGCPKKINIIELGAGNGEMMHQLIKVFKRFDFLLLLLFLPNMHFWTASLGKGSTIFFGLMMFTYGIVKPGSRIFLLILSSFIIYHIRPHVFMFVAVGAVAGYMSGKEQIPFWQKASVFVVLIGTLLLVQDQILAVINKLKFFKNYGYFILRNGNNADKGTHETHQKHLVWEKK